MRTTLWIGVIIVLMALVAGCLPGSPKTGAVKARQVKAHWIGGAPDFTFAGADGKEHRASDYAGLPLVINFWSKG